MFKKSYKKQYKEFTLKKQITTHQYDSGFVFQSLTSHCKSEKAEKFQNKSTLNSHFNHIQFTFEKHKNSS